MRWWLQALVVRGAWCVVCGECVEGVSPSHRVSAVVYCALPCRCWCLLVASPRRSAWLRLLHVSHTLHLHLTSDNCQTSMTYEEMTGEVLSEMRGPTWILDRRNSGKLFWRRDSTSSTEKNRVKFRCDVEVMEYLRMEPEPPQYEDWSSDEEDDYGWRLRPWDQEIPPPSTFWGGVCMAVIAAVITYQWLSV